MKRRDAVRLLGAAALGPQAEAWARYDTALKGSASPSPRLGVGRLKQSVCRWPYRQIPLPDLCRAALDIGLAGIDLLTRDEWDQVRQCGLVCSMGYAVHRRDFIPTGFNDRANHPMLLRELEEALPLAARHGEGKGLLQLPEQHRVVRPIVEAGRDEIPAVHGIPHRAHQAALAHLIPLVPCEQVDTGEPDVERGPAEVREGNLAIRPAADGLLQAAYAEAWARRCTALKGSVVPSPGFSLGTEGGRSEQSHRVPALHQNSSRFRYSQLARMDAN